MLTLRWACASLIILSPALAVAAGAPPTADQKKIADLRAIATGDDRPAAYKAFMDLTTMGDPARPTLLLTLRTVLLRDHQQIEENLRKIAAAGDLKALEATIAQQQAAAIAKIDKLATAADTNAARAEYTKLSAQIKRVNDMYASRMLLLDIMQTRNALLGLWKDISAKTTPNPIDQTAEAKLSDSLMTTMAPYASAIKTLQATPLVWSNPEPTSAEQAGLLNYRFRRRVDAYNRAQASLHDKYENDLLGQINTYRDVLGLPPLEADPRLIQAARRHSKEMVDLKYFSNVSPNEQTKDAMARRKNAGYEGEGFWSEALGRGTSTGIQTFWAMFDQPPYHKGMTAISATSIGIGRWNQYWTVEIGESPRLMLAKEEEKTKAAVQGDIVPPQSPVAASSHGATTAGGSTGDSGGPITDPRQIKPRAPNGAGSVPGIPALPGVGGF